MVYDMLMQLALPYISILSSVAILYITLFVSLKLGLLIMGLLFLITAVRSIYGVFRTKDLGFLLFLTYGFVHTIFLIPTRFYALFTLKENGWSTR
jgi:hyaluronan synthase/N-acetylglucosaminyltransferase